MDGTHVGPTAPASLSGVATLAIALPKHPCVEVQAVLHSTPGGWVHCRIAYAAALTATSLATQEFVMTNGGAQRLRIVTPTPATQAYLYVFVTDASGASVTCGANDYIAMLASNV